MNAWTAKAGTRQIARLLCLIGAALLGAELVGRFVVPRVSKIEARVVMEEAAAHDLRATPGAPPATLIVGNSLLLASVTIAELTRQLEPEWHTQRFVVESSEYNDWYFGLRNLFANGSRPNPVVLMLNPRQLIADNIRGAYSAFHLFSAADSVRAGVRAGLHPTIISGLVLGHFSAYCGTREETRKVAFQKVVPRASELAAVLVGSLRPAREIDGSNLRSESARRLVELSRLCAAYAVRCMFVLAPRLGGTNSEDLIVIHEAERAGLRAADLQPDDTWSMKDFEPDGFHMNPNGAVGFTAAFGTALKAALGQPRHLRNP